MLTPFQSFAGIPENKKPLRNSEGLKTNSPSYAAKRNRRGQASPTMRGGGWLLLHQFHRLNFPVRREDTGEVGAAGQTLQRNGNCFIPRLEQTLEARGGNPVPQQIEHLDLHVSLFADAEGDDGSGACGVWGSGCIGKDCRPLPFTHVEIQEMPI